MLNCSHRAQLYVLCPQKQHHSIPTANDFQNNNRKEVKKYEKKKIKLTALILLISVIFGTLSVFASDNSMTEIRSLKANDDPNFPVDFRLSVPMNQAILDPGETVPETAQLKISMKEEYADTYCYMNHFSIKEDESTINENGEKALPLLSDTAVPADSTLTVDIVPDYSYNFSFETYTRTATIKYLGVFYTGYDWDGTFCVGVTYHKYTDTTVETAATYAISNAMVSETEDNGTMAAADEMSLGAMAQGCMTSTSDHDYYKFTTISGQSGYVDIRMHNPDLYSYVGPDLEEGFVTDYDLVVRNSSGTIIGSSYNREGVADEYVRISVSENTTYYIETVCYRENGSNETYIIETNYDQTFTWYTQMTSYCTSPGEYYTWNSHNLDKMFFPQTDAEYAALPFINNSSIYNHQMSTGCNIAAVAMVLRNMNATMQGRDIRMDDYESGYIGTLIADPYSVVLANAAITSDDIKKEGDIWNVYHADSTDTDNTSPRVTDPFCLYDNFKRICRTFGETAPTVVSLSNTSEQQAIYDIEGALEAGNGGIILRLETTYDDGSPKHHSIVIVGINPNSTSSSSFEDRFLVCDSGTTFADKGDNVVFSSSYSYIHGYRFEHATKYYVFG